MLYVADSTLSKITALAGADAATVQQALEDAGTVYAHLQEAPWATHEEVVQWAEQSMGITADRTETALRVLTEGGKVVGVNKSILAPS